MLICVGGVVTTYNAGMAVPDWPTTEGSWLYPMQKWLSADWDVFLEHGHRVLAQGLGLVAIALAVALWTLDRRKGMRWLAAAAVAGVVLQGILGGLRVLWSERLLAMVHGCMAPLFFGLGASLVALTSVRWRQGGAPREHPAASRWHRLTLALPFALYAEIVLGAQLRHPSPAAGPGGFELWLWLKLITAGLIAVGLAWLVIDVLHHGSGEAMVVRRTGLLAALVLVQLVLGAGTWVTNFGWPLWFKDWIWPAQYTVVAEGPLQVLTTTAHAAVGSLSLGASLSLALWSRRRLCRVSP